MFKIRTLIFTLYDVITSSCLYIILPPKDAATATEPATVPAALAAAANPLAPMTGMMVPNVGAKALKPAAMAGAANPENQNKIPFLEIFGCK